MTFNGKNSALSGNSKKKKKKKKNCQFFVISIFLFDAKNGIS